MIYNPERCKYEQLVQHFFGLPDTVDEKTEIKADFGLLVALLAWAMEWKYVDTTPFPIKFTTTQNHDFNTK